MTITLSGDEFDVVQRAARSVGKSAEEFAHDAAVGVTRDDAYRARVAAISKMVAEKSAELNRRLE